MTSQEAGLVQSSFRLVEPILEDAVLIFYNRLFELDPALRSMFAAARDVQARKLAQALRVVVTAIDRPEQIKGAVEALGRRHGGYGVRDRDYATVGAALLATLEAGLGAAFTPDVRAAWSAAYSWLAFTMQRAAARNAAAETTLPVAV